MNYLADAQRAAINMYGINARSDIQHIIQIKTCSIIFDFRAD